MEDNNFEQYDFVGMFAAKKTAGPLIYQDKTIYLADKIKINARAEVTLTILETNSDDYIEGVILETKGKFIFSDGFVAKKEIVFLENKFRKETFIVESKKNYFWVQNAWLDPTDEFQVISYSSDGAAMIIEDNSNDEYIDKTYYCNDGFLDDDFNDVIFRIQIKK